MKLVPFFFIILSLLTMSCDQKKSVDDLDRQEEVPVEDTFEPIPTEIP